MKRTLSLLMLILAGVLALAACTTHTERPGKAQTEQLMEIGQQVYVEHCAECHQMDGKGWSNLYPNLAGNPIVTLDDPSAIIETVTYGQGSMMSFNLKLNNDEIAAVLTYIRNAWGNKAPQVSPRQIH